MGTGVPVSEPSDSLVVLVLALEDLFEKALVVLQSEVAFLLDVDQTENFADWVGAGFAGVRKLPLQSLSEIQAADVSLLVPIAGFEDSLELVHVAEVTGSDFTVFFEGHLATRKISTRPLAIFV